MNRLNPLLLAQFRSYSRICAVVVIAVCCVVLVGWAIGNRDLMCLYPVGEGKPPLQFMGSVSCAAAINLIVFALTLLAAMFEVDKRLRVACEVLTGCAIVYSFMVAYTMAAGIAFENLRFFESDSGGAITYPGPLSVEIGLDLAVIGVSILLLRLKSFQFRRGGTLVPYSAPPSYTPTQIAALAAIPVPLLIVLAAATEIANLCALGNCFTMSTGYAVLALFLCSAILLSQPDVGMAATYSGTSTGSLILRRSTLFLCAIPLLLIMRTVVCSIPALKIDDQVGWVGFVFATLVLAAAFILPGVRTSDRIESELSQQLNVTKDELEKTRQSRSEMMQAAAGTASGGITIRYKKICLQCTNEFDDTHRVCPNDESPLSRVIDDSLIGVTFADKYEIFDLLGTGGMSTVYRAKHKFLNKDVAVKVLKGNAASSSDGLRRFQREARATSAVSHIGIVGISDFGVSPDGRAFLVMDYLQGESVSQMLDRVGPLKLPLLVALGSQVCEALGAAHEKGIVHRDLKPSNIMLVNNDDGTAQAKIVDFGLAKLMEEDSHLSMRITQTGECFGSPLYMSPEQCMGKRVDHRSDIYALGAILYELVCGYPPIMGQGAADTVRRQVTDRPSPIPPEFQVPNEVRLVIYKCLHKDPSWRPQTAYEVQDVLGRIDVWSSRS